MTYAEVEICCVCRLEQIEVEFHVDRTTIVTPGAVDGCTFGYSQGRYVGPKCAKAVAI